MSSSSMIRVSIAAESSFGVLTTPTFMILPVSSQRIRDRGAPQSSATIRADRNVRANRKLGRSVAGSLELELTFASTSEALFHLMRAILCTTETAAVTVTGNSADEGDNYVERASGSFVSDGYEVGDIVLISGNQFASDDGYRRVSAVDTLVLEFDGPVWTGSSVAVSVKRAARMKNGTTKYSFHLEVARTDLDKAQIFKGVTFDSASIEVVDENFVTMTVNVLGSTSDVVDAPLSGTGPTAVYVTSATYAAPVEYEVLAAPDVPTIAISGVEQGAKRFSLSMENRVQLRTAVGPITIRGASLSTFRAAYDVEIYIDDFSEIEVFNDDTESSLWFILVDGTGKGWSFSLPTTKHDDAGADTAGMDQEDYLTLSGMASLNSAQACTLKVQRWL